MTFNNDMLSYTLYLWRSLHQAWSLLLNRCRRRFLPYLITRAKKQYNQPPRGAMRLTRNTYFKVKVAQRILHEAEALRYLAEHTNIPIPQVLDVWIPEDQRIPRRPPGLRQDEASWRALNTVGHLVMSRIEGEPLTEAGPKLSVGQWATVAGQLRAMMEELRALKQPKQIEGFISSCFGGATYEERLQNEFFGPFPDEASFNDWRVSLLDLPFLDKHDPPGAQKVRTLRQQMPDNHSIVFSHGDLQRQNIMVLLTGPNPGDVRVTGIIDWEMAGWRPEHWDYLKWTQGAMHDKEHKAFVESILPSYMREYETERELQMMRGGIFGAW